MKSPDMKVSSRTLTFPTLAVSGQIITVTNRSTTTLNLVEDCASPEIDPLLPLQPEESATFRAVACFIVDEIGAIRRNSDGSQQEECRWMREDPVAERT